MSAGILLCAFHHPVQAEFLQPVAVWVSNGEETQDKLIDGLGLDSQGVGTPEATHVTDSSEMWSSIGSIKADAIFDLGMVTNLTRVYVWNYNASGNTDYGMKDVEVLVSSDTVMTNANFTAISQIALKQGGTTSQVFNVTATDVRLVKLRGLSNWGNGFAVGLAEVRFESGSVTGKVPSVVINSPHAGDIIDRKTNTVITLKATITDKDNNLAKVEFFDGSTNKLGEKTVSPYSLDIKAPTVGDHAYRIVATDKTGYMGWAEVTVTVRELVADRIIQIDDTADEGTDINQISYTGTWNLAQGNDSDPRFKHNDHYESNNNKNDYFEVRFTGVKIDIYATVASHHGTGRATIDGGTPYTVNYKATQRGEQVLVWSSPILPQREHVLRVTVVGDGVVTADRFDVSVSDKPVDKAVIKNIVCAFTNLLVEVEDVGQSVVNPATVKLFLDNILLPAPATKSAAITTISNQLATALLPGSTHTVRFTATEVGGVNITNEAPLVLPKPFFPLTGLGEPASISGKWGMRQIWGMDRIDAVVVASDIALLATQSGFAGHLQDTNVQTINFSFGGVASGFIPDDLPFPAEASGLTTDDFVVVARARVVVPTRGDWTIGVHSDDGFALRFIGAPFDSVNGNGIRDDTFPEYMAVANTTTDSSTRGILKDIPAGKYDLEFIYFQRTGGGHCEIYAAPGEVLNDGDSADWQLIGSPSGLQIVAGDTTPITLRQVAKSGVQVILNFDSPQPDGPHQLLESGDLRSWTPAVGASFEKTGGKGVRVTVGAATASMKFYRVTVNAP